MVSARLHTPGLRGDSRTHACGATHAPFAREPRVARAYSSMYCFDCCMHEATCCPADACHHAHAEPRARGARGACMYTAVPGYATKFSTFKQVFEPVLNLVLPVQLGSCSTKFSTQVCLQYQDHGCSTKFSTKLRSYDHAIMVHARDSWSFES